MDRDWKAFPDENPNLVVEVDAGGVVRYANPEALARFPEIQAEGWRHRLLAGIPSIVGGFATGANEYVSRELSLEEGVFEQKICFGRTGNETVFRIYVHDVTALRRAEAEMEKLAVRLAIAQEEERHRISRELHDEAGQALAALKISMKLLRDDLEVAAPPSAEHLDQLIELVDSTRQQIRTIAHDLRPQALDAVGLDRALEQFASDFAAMAGLDVSYSGEPVTLSDAAQMCVYRVAQEALANIATHANASGIVIALRRENENVILEISDNGVGFDTEAETPPFDTGLGIRGMKERVELLRGKLEITSGADSGTSLIVTLPDS